MHIDGAYGAFAAMLDDAPVDFTRRKGDDAQPNRIQYKRLNN